MSIEWILVIMMMGICLIEDPATEAKSLATIETWVNQLMTQFKWDEEYARLVLVTRFHRGHNNQEFELIEFTDKDGMKWELVPITE